MPILEVIRRHYEPKDFVVSVSPTGDKSYAKAVPGTQCDPGLIIFRYDSDLFYANANRFVDVEALIDKAPDPVRWLILDAQSVDDVDYSAGIAIAGLMDYLTARHVTFALSGADTGLVDTLRAYDLLERIGADHLHDSLSQALDAFRADSTSLLFDEDQACVRHLTVHDARRACATPLAALHVHPRAIMRSGVTQTCR